MLRTLQAQLRGHERLLGCLAQWEETCSPLVPVIGRAVNGTVFDTTRHSSSSHSIKRGGRSKWNVLKSEGYNVNPCNSKLHPAVVDAGIEPDSEEELPVQEAYTPESTCFGCGMFFDFQV